MYHAVRSLSSRSCFEGVQLYGNRYSVFICYTYPAHKFVLGPFGLGSELLSLAGASENFEVTQKLVTCF